MKYSVSIPAGGATAFSPSYNGAQQGGLHPNCVPVVDAPALNTTQLPDAQTISYSLIESNASDLSSPISTTLMGTQTGAGGTGAAAVTFGTRLRYVGGQFWGHKITASASAAASGASAQFNYATI